LLAAILSRRVSPLVALIAVPMTAALAGGFGREIGKWITSGLSNIAPVVAMFVFAILFFGVMTDAGLFDPIVARVRRIVGTRPAWIVPGTALLAVLVHLDGSGAVTFLVVVPAMLPLYEALGMDRRLLACAAAMAAGVMNVVPWGGPTLRAAAALKLPVAEIFNPMLPLLAVGLLYVVGVSYVLGRREEKRLARTGPGPGVALAAPVLSEEQRSTRRPRLIWLNGILTVPFWGALSPSCCHPRPLSWSEPPSPSSSTTRIPACSGSAWMRTRVPR
jgi:CitMHS family citrate-Mg2+:H+ or citrate-Ca2+:H+ symporter